MARFLSIYDFLKNTWQNYNHIVTTDVKDVYFQTNPFEALKGHKLVVATEGLKYKDEPWGRDNLLQSYGPYVYEHFKENEIYNQYVKDNKKKYIDVGGLINRAEESIERSFQGTKKH